MDMLAMKLVRTYGAEVLDSPEFRKAKEQKHHHVCAERCVMIWASSADMKSSAIIWCAGRNIQRNPFGLRGSFSAILTNARKT